VVRSDDGKCARFIMCAAPRRRVVPEAQGARRISAVHIMVDIWQR